VQAFIDWAHALLLRRLDGFLDASDAPAASASGRVGP
jgi:hypothetical protein